MKGLTLSNLSASFHCVGGWTLGYRSSPAFSQIPRPTLNQGRAARGRFSPINYKDFSIPKQLGDIIFIPSICPMASSKPDKMYCIPYVA